MAKFKFRSWNEARQKFFYFEDGIYQRCGIDRNEYSIGLFDWNNAEQGLTINEFTFYVGDKIEAIYTDIYGYKHKITGVVFFEDNEFYINENFSKHYGISTILNAEQINIFSKIHENWKDR